MHPLTQTALDLVKTRILGARKGLPDVPLYIHSQRVETLLRETGHDDTTCLAGLLHDILEDSDTTAEELSSMGFDDEVITLVQLCSHDKEIENKDLRWMHMIIGLVEAKNKKAWAIKIADVLDNVQESYAMKKERAQYMVNVKIPLILSASASLLAGTPLWVTLAEKHHSITESIRHIQKELDYIEHEIQNSLSLNEPYIKMIQDACTKVREQNYTVAGPALIEAISSLQKITDSLESTPAKVLINECAANMLSNSCS